MGFRVTDKEIDRKLEDMVKQIQDNFGIKNCSKTDAIRFLLNIRKQGKKTDSKWNKI